jgi:hypothetical protein
VTEAAGVRRGFWGWGSTFADLDNDRHLDRFHVNGFGNPDAPAHAEYLADPARLFVSNCDGTFSERAAELGVDDTGQGRGLTAFDHDRDGDLGLFVSNYDGPPRLFRNEEGNASTFLVVKLRGRAPNTEAIGARVSVTVGDTTQLRELRAGTNYVSQDPAEAHFGLGSTTSVDELRVVWPDGTTAVQRNVRANRFLVLSAPFPGAASWAPAQGRRLRRRRRGLRLRHRSEHVHLPGRPLHQQHRPSPPELQGGERARTPGHATCRGRERLRRRQPPEPRGCHRGARPGCGGTVRERRGRPVRRPRRAGGAASPPRYTAGGRPADAACTGDDRDGARRRHPCPPLPAAARRLSRAAIRAPSRSFSAATKSLSPSAAFLDDETHDPRGVGPPRLSTDWTARAGTTFGTPLWITPGRLPTELETRLRVQAICRAISARSVSR